MAEIVSETAARYVHEILQGGRENGGHEKTEYRNWLEIRVTGKVAGGDGGFGRRTNWGENWTCWVGWERHYEVGV